MYLDQAEAALREQMDTPGLARTLARRAIARRLLGKYQASLDDGLEALSISDQNEDLRTTKLRRLRAIGMSLYHLGRLNEAIEKFRQSLEVLLSIGELTNSALAQMELGMCLRSAGNFRLALEQYEKALAYWRKVNNTTACQSF